MKIIEYYSIFATLPQDLDRLVNGYIKKGWTPLGGICFVYHKTGMVLAQSVIKYEE